MVFLTAKFLNNFWYKVPKREIISINFFRHLAIHFHYHSTFNATRRINLSFEKYFANFNVNKSHAEFDGAQIKIFDVGNLIAI